MVTLVVVIPDDSAHVGMIMFWYMHCKSFPRTWTLLHYKLRIQKGAEQQAIEKKHTFLCDQNSGCTARTNMLRSASQHKVFSSVAPRNSSVA